MSCKSTRGGHRTCSRHLQDSETTGSGIVVGPWCQWVRSADRVQPTVGERTGKLKQKETTQKRKQKVEEEGIGRRVYAGQSPPRWTRAS